MGMRRSRALVVVTGLLAFAWLAAVPAPAAAQTPFVPYFFKNDIRYDRFDWHIYKTDHFEIYYYPAVESHLERVASYAESAYQHVSATLKHDLASKVPLIVFKTESEFLEQHIDPGGISEGVLAFAEPNGGRMVLPIDEPSDRLYQLITHELTHIFEFDIIPRGIIGGQLPLWMDEGLSDYMAGAWNPLDLMRVRDAALTDTVPRMSEMYNAPMSGRTPYNLGHATWEFIESKWGQEGLRQFIFSLRKSAIGGGDSAYEEALKVKADDFDDQFDRYLKERFKAFRDKERPADYGRNLAPRPDRTDYIAVESLAASPSGEMLAALVFNIHDLEYDVILLSARDGQVIRNLTPGFDKDRGFEYVSVAGGLRGNIVPWLAWAPVGDRIAYFVRTEKQKTLVIQNVVTGKAEQKVELKTVDAPESPAFSPDGTKVAFAGMQGAVSDIFVVDLKSGEISNVTGDDFADYAPTYAPDGRSLVYAAHISGNDKLFQIDLATKQRKQLTFGTHDDTAPTFLDDHTIIFTSTATDPNVPIPPDMARNGNIPNVWSLDLTNAQLKEYTDAAAGNVTPVVLHQSSGPKIAFVSYFKGENGIHIIEPTKAVATVASSDFGAPGPVVDFQPPLSHTLMRDNMRKKGAFEKMSMLGRPPVNVGVTSGGTFYGNTQIAMADVLGDKQISFFAESVSQFRTTAFSYLNIERRMQYALQGFSQDVFYYGQNAGVLYDPVLGPIVNSDRQLAEAVQSSRGGTIFAIYPFNRYSRVELFTGYMHLSESYTNQALQDASLAYQAGLGLQLFRNGSMIPVGVSFVQETAVLREYGPVAGRAMQISYNSSPDLGTSWISRQTFTVDLRHYTRIAANGVLAVRLKAQRSWGEAPDFMYFGGNSELRGYDYLSFLGHKGFFANAELRFPLVDALLTPLGVFGGLRGVAFADLGAAGFNDQAFVPWTSKPETRQDIIQLTQDASGNLVPAYGPPQTITGFRLQDARASYGLGLQTQIFGLPMHFDWAWRTLFNTQYEDALFGLQALSEGHTSGSEWFRSPRFGFWIGYDF